MLQLADNGSENIRANKTIKVQKGVGVLNRKWEKIEKLRDTDAVVMYKKKNQEIAEQKIVNI